MKKYVAKVSNISYNNKNNREVEVNLMLNYRLQKIFVFPIANDISTVLPKDIVGKFTDVIALHHSKIKFS